MTALAVAADIGGTNTKLGVVDANGSLVRQASIATPPLGDPVPLVEGIVRAVTPWFADASAMIDRRLAVSVAGFLDRDRRRMIENANLPALCGFPLRDALEERLRMPCVLEVDSNAALLADVHHGAARNAHRVLGITVGTGLGGAVMVEGTLLRYTGECAGDIGHIIVERDGRRCTCGAHGCLEAMVCTAALSERANGRPVREIIGDAQRGEATAREALAETGRWLGLGLASLTPLFAPELITIGGGVATAGDLLLHPAREAFQVHAAPSTRQAVRIAGSMFDGWEGVVGAASLLRTHTR